MRYSGEDKRNVILKELQRLKNLAAVGFAVLQKLDPSSSLYSRQDDNRYELLASG